MRRPEQFADPVSWCGGSSRGETGMLVERKATKLEMGG
jgi:hypothetical protein